MSDELMTGRKGQRIWIGYRGKRKKRISKEGCVGCRRREERGNSD